MLFLFLIFSLHAFAQSVTWIPAPADSGLDGTDRSMVPILRKDNLFYCYTTKVINGTQRYQLARVNLDNNEAMVFSSPVMVSSAYFFARPRNLMFYQNLVYFNCGTTLEASYCETFYIFKNYLFYNYNSSKTYVKNLTTGAVSEFKIGVGNTITVVDMGGWYEYNNQLYFLANHNRIERLTDPAAVTNLYVAPYTTIGNIKTVKYPPNEFNERPELEYFYDPMGKYVIQVKDPVFNLSSYATYNPLLDTVTESTDVSGNKMRYQHDAYGRPLWVMGPNDLQAQAFTILYQYYDTPVTLSNGNKIYLFTAKTTHLDPDHPGNDIETVSFADVKGEVIQVKKDIEIDGLEKMSVSGRGVDDNLGRSVLQYHPVFENKDAAVNNKLSLALSSYHTSAAYDYKDRKVSSIDEAGYPVDNKFFIDNGRFRTETIQMQNASDEIRTEVLADAEGKTVETRNYLPGQVLTSLFTYNQVGGTPECG
ncbi:hypothetical protein [uncultured Chryseobacterium sp.]|uniref:hypothetical protein n=1 Tax=uncultured Chryseobacterium sp. TaxID=259322 RepID=UPI0025F49D0F|nr:hypothetical protein [uncultured Chryseobacterium sp.]